MDSRNQQSTIQNICSSTLNWSANIRNSRARVNDRRSFDSGSLLGECLNNVSFTLLVEVKDHSISLGSYTRRASAYLHLNNELLCWHDLFNLPEAKNHNGFIIRKLI